jgi:hypothetical protein
LFAMRAPRLQLLSRSLSEWMRQMDKEYSLCLKYMIL